MKPFKSFLDKSPTKQEHEQPRGVYNPPEGTTNHPLHKMRDYTSKELDWEHGTEYEKYSKPHFPKAFKDRAHFQHEYDKSPLTHLSDKEMSSLGNSNVQSVLRNKGSKQQKEEQVRNIIGKRRNVDKIWHDMHHGQTAPPIILKHKRGLHLMAGNTRLLCSAAHGLNLPCKVIDISHIH